MHRFAPLLAIALTFALPAPAALAQSEETLADIRQEMSVLYVEIQRLKRELSTTGGADGVTTGGSLIDRVAAIESELQRLTSKTEELEFRIDRVVSDGSNRLDDLEFRVCELDSKCNIDTWEPGKTLGGVKPTDGHVLQGTDTDNGGDGPQLAVGEQADFDTALAALEAGNYEDAALQFDNFQQNYPGGPMTMNAKLLQGVALENAGRVPDAARAYLETFSADQTGPLAPEALFRLGVTLGKLNKTSQACVTLSEVERRFPTAEVVVDAQEAISNMGCQ